MVDFIKSLAVILITGATYVLGTPLEGRGLDKPVLKIPVDPEDYKFSQALQTQLQSAQGTITPTSFKIKICYDCQNTFEEEGYDHRKEMEMFNVTYADCAEPWIMCRHKNASSSQELIVKYVALVPLNMRKYLRHVITLPGPEGPDNFLDGTVEYDEGNLILRGRVSFQTLLAGAARALADHGLPAGDSYLDAPYWESKAWLDAYTKDTALVNDEAKMSQEENLKQMTVMAVYDSQLPGFGDGHLVPEWNKFENMLKQIQKDAQPGSLMRTAKSTCDGRIPSDRPGTME